MITEKDYCDYDTCVALKELGYKAPTSAYYMPKNSQLIFAINQFRGGAAMDCFYSNNSLPKECMASDFIDAPTMWEAQKWLREEKHIDVGATWDDDEDNWFTYIKQMSFPDWSGTSVSHSCYSSYEEALSEGILTAVEILKEDETIHE